MATLKINYVVNPIYINGGFSPWDKRVGGSEEMVIETAVMLAERGHEVQVFHNGRHGNFKGVEFRERDEYEPGDITINMNYPQFHHEGRGILWTTLTDHPDLSKFEAVCAISEYAEETTNIVHDNVHIVPPGYHPREVYAGVKVPKQCLYASSPDRGLVELLRAWPKVYAEHPDARLLVTYGGAEYDVPGATFLGEVDNETMGRLYASSDIWCHPATGNELYCMTGVKAQVAGCVPVIIPNMALGETVRHGFMASIDTYADVLSMALSNIGGKKDYYRGLLSQEKYPTWDNTVDRLLEVIQ